MSTSPPTHSTKRPLEEASSPSRADQPDAKRPALDKVLRNDGEVKEVPASNGLPPIPPTVASSTETNGDSAKTNGEKTDGKDSQGDTIVPDAGLSDGADAKPITSTASNTVTQPSAGAANAHDETAWIHIRAVISSPEAATIIGKGGENVSKIRQMSSAKCTVSDYQKGAVERILTVSGVVDAAAKVGSSRFLTHTWAD
jgi:heterogeneous nuclear rnp K-like protein